ncbi:alpha-1,4-glucan--maltose-1-phosphate maltosyltransferase [Immundisolibacter sp.]|uniref:alpha-1,4-glucan--maltose-1-phosphate maltosyltransferase n=2 Tax=Immundisolibacter sp. TaxID=1934948 RepID=UPI00356615C8
MPDIGAADGRQRVIIEGVTPEVDGGRFPVKRSVGEQVVVEADIFCDGHEVLRCLLRYRCRGAADWQETPMQLLGNDRWRATFSVDELGTYEYTLVAWVDHFLTWRHDLARREDEQDIALALLSGAALLEAAAGRASAADRKRLGTYAKRLRATGSATEGRALGADADLARLMDVYSERRHASEYERCLCVTVDPQRARFSAWYELFPRSAAATDTDTAHGTFADCEKHLPGIAAMGFDVLYLPPIHPIGSAFRKGPNNALVAGDNDPGSPWAIGAADGGHKAIHAQLGTLKDFRQLVKKAREHGLELAMDIAFQCSPDHPYVKEHPDWFRWRPDGTVQYAENPPKKYQDIYPLDFETESWRELWLELKSVIDFWLKQGVRIFRVDNPHTKPFPMWEWLIGEVKRTHPETIFLAEAFTRPRIMHRLAKLGFTQSYTYFTWRNTKQELTEYLTELSQDGSREYFRPNLWPNTPDILPESLQFGGRPAFLLRVALAATLGANYGIYGPAFELMEHQPRGPGSEEYLDSEKYQIRQWDLDRSDSLRHYIARLNRIRRDNPALQGDWSLRFHPIDNDMLLCFSKSHQVAPDEINTIVVVANLDPYNPQSGWINLPLTELGIDPDSAYQAHDLLSDARYLWQGPSNFVRLEPDASPVHILRLRRRVRSERDFDYFL